MSIVRISTGLAVSVLALTASLAASAQETAQAPAQDDIIVTGTRAEGRTRLDSAAPVDVLTASSLQRQGTTELGSALAAVAPSIDFPRPSATDGTDAIRPATLRGLSPDQTLVLINGVRGHTSALLNVNGSVGRGSAAVDLNTIPTVALDRIEVLRDGASAQYGSDAIAGVVNLRLREASSGGGASVDYGFYNTDVNTARADRHVTGEHAVTVSGWQGVKLGEDGFLTVSGEYMNRQPTNRADYDPRVTPERVTARFGDPQVEQYTFVANAGITVAPGWQLYGWGSYQHRDSRSAAFPRLASALPADVLTLYPDGFLPIINSKSEDINSAFGLRGDVGEWKVDVNLSYGRNRIDLNTLNSANYSYGANSPRNFYDGRLTYQQLVGGLDVTRKFDVFQSLNLAFGVEGRSEWFSIGAGDRASYDYYDPANPTGTPGAQGYGGLSPLNVVDRNRRAISGYLDVEAQVTDAFQLGLAGRVEDYSDFGSTANGKVTARYDFTPWFALRGSVSTGFRAPSLQQQYFTQIAQQVVVNGQQPVLTGTYPSTSPVAAALGGVPLRPEKSTNFSAGTVIRAGGFELTIDGYYIKIRDQIGLSENITGSVSPDVASLLAANNVSAARFFINGLRSTSKGIDAVAHYKLATPAAGTFDFTLAGNVNKIDVSRHIGGVTGALIPADLLFARSRILTIEEGTPGEKVTGTIDWSLNRIGALARVTYYGNVNQPGTTAATDLNTGRHAITDLELRYQAPKGAQLGIGVNNLFDVYPDKSPAALNSNGVVGFPFYSPFGFNGRYVYVRAGLNW
ncbi:MAG: TonB-dependent receptor [Sphingomonas bacterium]